MAFELFRMAGNIIVDAANALSTLGNVESRSRRTAAETRRMNEAFIRADLTANGFSGTIEELDAEVRRLADGEERTIRTTGNFRENITKLGNEMKRAGQGISNAGKMLTLGMTLPIVAALGKSISLASDLAESANVVNVTFGKSAKEVTDWSKTLNDKFGVVQLEAMKYVGSMGAMLKSSGLSTKASKDMAQGLVELTGDMSSFYNLSHEETWEKIRSGIGGETEPLKALGINMSVANMEAYALSVGIKKPWKEMKQAEQTQLRYNYLMKVTADSHGDFARTSEGFANKLRMIQGRLTELGTKIGTILLPYAEKLLKVVDKWASKFTTLNTHSQKVVIVVGLFAAAIGPLLVVLGTLISMVGSLVTIIGALSAPILIVVGVIGVVVVEWAALITVMIIVAAKAGLLKLAFEGIKNIIQIFVSIIKGDTNKALDILVKKFGYSKEEAKAFIEKVIELKDRIVILAEKIKVGLIKAFNFLIDKVKDVTKWLYDHRHEIMKVIEILIDLGIKLFETADKFAEFVKKVKPKITELKETFVKEFTEIKTVTINKFEEIRLGIIKKFNETKTGITNKFTEIKTAIINKLNEWEAAIRNWFTTLPERTKSWLIAWKNTIVNWLEEQNRENIRQYTEWGNALQSWFTNIPTRFNEWFAAWKIRMSEKFEEIKTNISQKLNGWMEAMRLWFAGIPTRFNEWFAAWKVKISQKFEEIKVTISEKLNGWWGAINSWFVAMPGRFENGFNKTWKSLRTSFDNAKKMINEKLDGWWSTIQNWFTEMPKKHIIKSSGRSMITKVADGNREKKSEFMDKLGKLIVDVLVGAGKVAFVVALATGRELIKRIISGVNNIIPSLKGSIKNIVGYIVNPIKALPKTMFNSGANLISGLIDGIKSKLGDLKNVVSKGAGIIGDFIGWESPTKEGPGKNSDKWGPNLMKMLSETMLGKRALLQDSVRKIAGDLSFDSVSANIGFNAGARKNNVNSTGEKIILQINNPKFFNDQDVDKMMNPTIRRLQQMLNVKRSY
jgi:hypothetical protein